MNGVNMNKYVKITAIVLCSMLATGCVAFKKRHATPKEHEHAVAFNKQGRLFALGKSYFSARLAFDAAIKKDPYYASPHNNQGLLYMRRKKYDLAISEFNDAIKINPIFTKAYSNRGDAYYGKGLFKKAAESYTEAIDINNEYDKAYIKRGIINFFKLNNKTQACLDWKAACELDTCKLYNKALKDGDCK